MSAYLKFLWLQYESAQSREFQKTPTKNLQLHEAVEDMGPRCEVQGIKLQPLGFYMHMETGDDLSRARTNHKDHRISDVSLKQLEGRG